MDFIKNLYSPGTVKTGLVFIVDDSPTYAGCLEYYIKTNFPGIKQIKVFATGDKCLDEISKRPDLVIMDYLLEGKYNASANGLDYIKKIRQVQSSINMVMLSVQQNVDVVIDAVKRYGCSYITKNTLAFQRVGSIINDIY